MDFLSKIGFFNTQRGENNPVPRASRWKNLSPLKADTLNLSKRKKSKIYQKPLTDKEFRSLDKKIYQKITKIPLAQRRKEFLEQYIDKNKAPLANRLLSDSFYLDSDNVVLKEVPELISSITSFEDAKRKNDLVDVLEENYELNSQNDGINTALLVISKADNDTKAKLCEAVLKSGLCSQVEFSHSAKRFISNCKNEEIKDFAIDTLIPLMNKKGENSYSVSAWFEGVAFETSDIDFARKLSSLYEQYEDENLSNNLMDVAYYLMDDNKELVLAVAGDEQLLSNDDFISSLGYFRYEKNDEKIQLLTDIFACKRLKDNSEFMAGIPDSIRFYSDEKNFSKFKNLVFDERFIGHEDILNNVLQAYCFVNNEDRKQLFETVINNPSLVSDKKFMKSFAKMVKELEANTTYLNRILSDEKLCSHPEFNKKILYYFETLQQSDINDSASSVLDTVVSNEKLCSSKGLSNNVIELSLRGLDSEADAKKINEFLVEVSKNDMLVSSDVFMENCHKIIVNGKYERVDKIVDRIMQDENLYSNSAFMKAAPVIIGASFDDKKYEVIKAILNNKRVCTYPEFASAISSILQNAKNSENVNEIINTLNDDKTPMPHIVLLLDYRYGVTKEHLENLKNVIGFEKANALSLPDTRFALNFIDVYSKKDINEIPSLAKKEFLRKLTSYNAGLFEISDELKEMFPLIPVTKKEYCSLLPALVRSLGIETDILSDDKISAFETSLSNLSETLKTIPDSDFKDIKISQQYDKNTFIKDVLAIVSSLDENERQKVFDYFGFELHHNKNSETGFEITGYPVNLNNGEKLSRINDEKTRQTVERLRPVVVNYSENNSINCSIKELEKPLNEIIRYLPELRTMINKLQNGNNGLKGAHEFDLFTHCLKVMQKVSLNPEFEKLNDSDKKVLLLASFLHDITKKEGIIDKTHPKESAFDAFFICKKFKLDRDEQIKLYTLINNHEWLGIINSSKNQQELNHNLKSYSYDLRHDNVLDMALIFTHADLMAVKKDNSFHDKKEGPSRIDFSGVVRSFGEAADYYYSLMKEKIYELKKTQPILPVTKIPTTDRINEAITTVNKDGSTNIKGVYKDTDGLIVIKFNEVEDWEKIGFPHGSVSKGIKVRFDNNEEADTGNIKFFIHGLDFEEHLSRFDAFSLIDSNALLSVSYAERPESKYRFFRTQGVILDVDTKYIHGGGQSDMGSGCKKTTDTFKENYIFNAPRADDRNFVSDLIKEELKMSDDEYIEFVKQNENKSFTEIEPVELRKKVIRALASINSNKRKGDRQYNEMYISNPKPPMGVFAYNPEFNETIKNPIDFLRESENSKRNGTLKPKTKFLREYAIEKHIPFIVFGD